VAVCSKKKDNPRTGLSLQTKYYKKLLVCFLVRYGKPCATFCPSGSKHPAAIFRGHTTSKTVLVFPFPYRGLKCPFHLLKYFAVCKLLIINPLLFSKRQPPLHFLRIAKIDIFLSRKNLFFEKGGKIKKQMCFREQFF